METYESESNNFFSQEPYIGMPIEWLHVDRVSDITATENGACTQVDACPLAMAYVPWQSWTKTYEPEIAWNQGTIFPDLDLPFLGGGAR